MHHMHMSNGVTLECRLKKKSLACTHIDHWLTWNSQSSLGYLYVGTYVVLACFSRESTRAAQVPPSPAALLRKQLPRAPQCYTAITRVLPPLPILVLSAGVVLSEHSWLSQACPTPKVGNPHGDRDT